MIRKNTITNCRQSCHREEEPHDNHETPGIQRKATSSLFPIKTTLVKLIDQWLTCLDDGDVVGIVVLDFRKAFDLVDRTLLLDKLAIYKYNDAALNLLASYVSNRHQGVDSGEWTSKPSIIKSGVPQ